MAATIRSVRGPVAEVDRGEASVGALVVDRFGDEHERKSGPDERFEADTGRDGLRVRNRTSTASTVTRRKVRATQRRRQPWVDSRRR
jgi:hypothetical protein